MYFPGRNFVSGIICTLEAKKPLETYELFFEKRRFFFRTPALEPAK